MLMAPLLAAGIPGTNCANTTRPSLLTERAAPTPALSRRFTALSGEGGHERASLRPAAFSVVTPADPVAPPRSCSWPGCEVCPHRRLPDALGTARSRGRTDGSAEAGLVPSSDGTTGPCAPAPNRKRDAAHSSPTPRIPCCAQCHSASGSALGVQYLDSRVQIHMCMRTH